MSGGAGLAAPHPAVHGEAAARPRASSGPSSGVVAAVYPAAPKSAGQRTECSQSATRRSLPVHPYATSTYLHGRLILRTAGAYRASLYGWSRHRQDNRERETCWHTCACAAKYRTDGTG